MEEGKIGTIEDWMPRSQKVRVGTIEMVVRELTIAKRDAVIKTLLSNVDVVPLLRPFVESMQSDGVASLDVGVLAGRLKEVAMKIIGNDLTHICCIVLDVEQNRNATGEPMSVVDEDEEHGFKYCREFFEYVKENLTLRQEQEVLTAAMVVNDFVGLVKNYSTLVAVNMKAARGSVKTGVPSV